MKKQETFRRLLAGEYDDARHVTVGIDLDLLEQMRLYGWWPYSRPLLKDDDSGEGPFRIHHREGSAEWKKDIRCALKNLDRI